MMRHTLISALTCCVLATTARADALTDAVIDEHILPTYQTLATRTQALDAAAQRSCLLTDQNLREIYGQAFDAWVTASHLRFGPSETDNRAFAMAFWPDSRTRTPKALRKMLVEADPSPQSPETFKTASIAVRGLYALEYLLYDDAYSDIGSAETRCALIQAIAHDLSLNAADLLYDWESTYAADMRSPSGPYRSDEEVHQELFKALNTGLEILGDMRIGRPLGTWNKPRPKRAEARRSGRSLRHVAIQLDALRTLALLLAEGDAAAIAQINTLFDKADHHVDALSDDPVFAGVKDPQQRFRLETLQQDVSDIKTFAASTLGPKLGVEAGFNALDGD